MLGAAGVLVLTGAFAAALVRSSPQPASNRPVDFLTSKQFPYGVQSFSIEAADFNDDGYDDLAVLDGGFLVLLLNDGHGAFSAPLLHRTGGTEARQLVTRDFNHDGMTDVGVCYADGDVWVFLGDGQGGLSVGQKFATGGSPTSCVTTDFDGDGNLDLAVALAGGSVTGRAQFMRNDGNANFAPMGPAVPIGRAPVRITAGDFDGDGHPDVAATNQFDGTVTVLFGDGTGHLSGALALSTVPPTSTTGEAAVIPLGPPLPFGVAAGDINGDGRDDLVVADGVYNFRGGGGPAGDPLRGSPQASALLDQEPRIPYGNAALFLAVENRGFSAPIFLPADNQPHDVRVLDADGDGRRDIVAGGLGVLTFIAGRDGQFIRRGSTLNPSIGVALTSADFDHDGHMDFALVGGATRVDVYFGTGGGQLAHPFYLQTEARPESGVQFPTQVAAADLNNDHIVDLVTTTGPGNTIVSFLGNGEGDFTLPVTSGVGRPTSWFALADLDDDGYTDVALVSSENNRNVLDLFLGDGHGHFKAGPRISSDLEEGRVQVADFNNDGRPDLVAVALRFDPGFNGAEVFLNSGSGSFLRTASLSTNKGTVDVLVGDVNNDKRVDVVLLNGNQPLSVFLGNGDGTFSGERLVPVITNGGVVGAALADFDEDGFLDLALSQGVGSSTDVFGAFWLQGDGHGGFVNPIHLTPEYAGLVEQSTFIGGVSAADFNGDGHADIAVADGGGVTFFQGDGRGAFAHASPFFAMKTVGVGPHLTVADLNGDGLLDLTSPAQGFLEKDFTAAVQFTLLFNNTAPARIVAGDADCDETVQQSDLTALTRRLFSRLYRPACVGADANGDTQTTAADLTAIIRTMRP